MDVLLVFHAVEGLLGHALGAAAAQVGVELVLEELAHALGPVLLLHHHQGRVLREGFRQQRAALAAAPITWWAHHWCATSWAVT